MKTKQHPKIPAPGRLAQAPWLGHPSAIIIEGFQLKENADGTIIALPVSVAEQLRCVESSINAEVLDNSLSVILKPFSSYDGPYRRNFSGRGFFANNAGADKAAASVI